MGVQKTIKKYLSCNGRNLSRGLIRDSATIQNRKGRVRSHRLIAAMKGRHEMLLAFCYLFTTETNILGFLVPFDLTAVIIDATGSIKAPEPLSSRTAARVGAKEGWLLS